VSIVGAAFHGPRIVDHTLVAVAWWDWVNCEKCSSCLWIGINVKCIRSVQTVGSGSASCLRRRN
jgi:hypothetical protein